MLPHSPALTQLPLISGIFWFTQVPVTPPAALWPLLLLRGLHPSALELLPFTYCRSWLEESSEGCLITFQSFSTRNISTFQRNSWQRVPTTLLTKTFASPWLTCWAYFLFQIPSLNISCPSIWHFAILSKRETRPQIIRALCLPVCCVGQHFVTPLYSSLLPPGSFHIKLAGQLL